MHAYPSQVILYINEVVCGMRVTRKSIYKSLLNLLPMLYCWDASKPYTNNYMVLSIFNVRLLLLLLCLYLFKVYKMFVGIKQDI